MHRILKIGAIEIHFSVNKNITNGSDKDAIPAITVKTKKQDIFKYLTNDCCNN